jgi:hypothetical protein
LISGVRARARFGPGIAVWLGIAIGLAFFAAGVLSQGRWWSTPFLSIGLGLVSLGFGLKGWMERDAHQVQRRFYSHPSAKYLEIPGGFGFTLVGVGLLIARRPVSDVLLVAGMLAIGVGMLSLLWQLFRHPFV